MPFFFPPMERDNPCPWVAEDAMHLRVRAKAWKPIRIPKSLVFPHPDIMPGFFFLNCSQMLAAALFFLSISTGVSGLTYLRNTRHNWILIHCGRVSAIDMNRSIDEWALFRSWPNITRTGL
jgi:hypothetical protein